jgi:kanamycin kinase
MERHPVSPDLSTIPPQFHPLLSGADVYDSSCSALAQVWFLDKAHGFYLKKAPKGALQKEAAMYGFFHSKGLAPEVIAYESLESDWMLTVRAKGEDCIHPMYRSEPQRLCDTTAQLLRMLHETPTHGCPVPDRTKDYLHTARKNYRLKKYDTTLFPDNWGYATAEEAWRELEENSKYLQTNTLLHGDYCLPNIVLDNWQFSSFIDLDTAGVGDRHVDLFWATWSLQFNLKTDRYRDRFLDAYGRDSICPELFRTVAAIEVFG